MLIIVLHILQIIPLDTGGSNNIDITLFQRQRRSNNVISTLFEPPMSSGLVFFNRSYSLQLTLCWEKFQLKFLTKRLQLFFLNVQQFNFWVALALATIFLRLKRRKCRHTILSISVAQDSQVIDCIQIQKQPLGGIRKYRDSGKTG